MSKSIVVDSFSSIVAAAHASMQAKPDASPAHVAKAVLFPALKQQPQERRTIAVLVGRILHGEEMRGAITAAQITDGAALRSILKAEGIDVTNAREVSRCVREYVYQLEGREVPTEKGTGAALKDYMRMAKRVQRVKDCVMGRDVLKRESANTAALRVPKAAQQGIEALLEQFDAKTLREALKRATAK